MVANSLPSVLRWGMSEQKQPEESQNFARIAEAIRDSLSHFCQACREIAANPEEVQAWLLANQLPQEVLDRIVKIARYDSSNLSKSQKVEVLEIGVILGDFYKD